MSRYVVILIVPIAVGSLIAVAVLLINGLRERRERRDMQLREAGRLNSGDYATPSTRPVMAKTDAPDPNPPFP